MAEVAHAGEYYLLGVGDIFGGTNPRDFVATLFNSIDEGADVAGYIVEEMDCWHFGVVLESIPTLLVVVQRIPDFECGGDSLWVPNLSTIFEW